MAALAEAFVRVRADTSTVREDIRKDFEKAGGESGDAFGKRFSRDANGRLRDERGKFVAEGEKLGEGLGDGANKGFARKIGSSGSGFGDVLKKAFANIAPNIPNLVSGFGQVGDSVGDLAGRFGHLGITGASALTGLTSSLAKVGAGAVALSTLGAGAASAGASLVALAGAILPVSGLVAALPGVIAGFVAINTVLKLSLYSVGDAMKAAYEGNMEDFDDAMLKLTDTAKSFATEFLATVPAMKEFQRAAQDGFFGELNGSLARFVELLSATQPKIVELASEMGKWARELLVFATAEKTIGQLNTILQLTRDALTDLRQGLQPVLTGFLDLGVVGTGFLRGLAPSIADAATKFGMFLSEAARSGQALEWMNTGLVVLKALGSIAKDVGGIFSGIFDAAEKSGAGALGILGQLLDRFNAFINSAKGQQVLVTVFESLHRVGKALAPVVEALAGALATIAPVVADIAVAFGPVLTSAIKSLAPALAALAPGLLTIVTGISSAVSEMGPHLLSIGQAISQAFAATGPIFAALGQAFIVLAPQLASVVAGFAPLVSVLIGALAPALAALGPGLFTVGDALARAFASPLVSEALLTLGTGISNLLIAVAPLIPPLIEIAAILVERVGFALTELAALLGPVIKVFAEELGPILPKIAQFLRELADAVLPLVQQFGSDLADGARKLLDVLVPLAEQFGGALANALRDLLPHLPPILDALREVGGNILHALLEVLPQVLPHLKDMAKAFGELFIEVAKILPDMIKFGGQILVEIIKQLPVLVPMIKDLALQFLGVLKELTPLLPKLMKLLMEIVLPLIPELPKLLPPLLDLVRVFTDLLKEATPMIDKLLESETVAAIVKIGARNMVLAFELVKDAINFAVGAIQVFIGTFFGLPGQVDAGLGKMGNSIKGWVNSIIGWFESVINIMADAIPGVGRVTFPRFANGAIVDKATMAMVGEAGREVVIPLTRPARARQLADDSGLTAMLAGMKVPELSAGRRLALAGAPAASGASAGSPPWSDRPLIGTYVAAAGQTAQRLMSDLRVEAIGASW